VIVREAVPAVSSSPVGAGLDHLRDLVQGVSPVGVGGLLEALSTVTDPRARRGVRHGLVAVLAVAVCAVVAGARSYAGIAQWATDLDAGQRAALGFGSRAPDGVTIWRVLTAVDPAALDKALGDWIGAQLAERRRGWTRHRRVLAVDGKTLRGARVHDGIDRANRTCWPAWTMTVGWSWPRSASMARPTRSPCSQPCWTRSRT
jgi:DDE_Tnp_1-associated